MALTLNASCMNIPKISALSIGSDIIFPKRSRNENMACGFILSADGCIKIPGNYDASCL